MKKYILIILIALLSSCDYMNEKTYENCEVTGKERITKGNTSYYLIFTDKGEFKITDQMFTGKFNSSSIYGRIKVGKKYRIVTKGYRSGLFSMYPNIQSVQLSDGKELMDEVENPECED